jgi:hypothetical protein
MAAHMTVSSGHSSWKEFCLSKRKGTEGFFTETMKFEDLLSGNDPFTHMNNCFTFLNLVNFLEGE